MLGPNITYHICFRVLEMKILDNNNNWIIRESKAQIQTHLYRQNVPKNVIPLNIVVHSMHYSSNYRQNGIYLPREGGTVWVY